MFFVVVFCFFFQSLFLNSEIGLSVPVFLWKILVDFKLNFLKYVAFILFVTIKSD